MIKLTKLQLDELFNGTKSWEDMAKDFTTEAGVTITSKMVQEMFKANGYNLRSRKRKTGDSWFTIVDDVDNTASTRSYDAFNVHTDNVEEVPTEEFA